MAIEDAIGGIGGGLLGLVGGLFGSSAASKRKQELLNIANMPGVSPGQAYTESLGAMQSAAPQAEEVARRQNIFGQSEIDRILGQEIPGYRSGQEQRAANALAMLRGEIPEDVTAQVQRRTAAQALEGGYGGSGMARNLTARDIGRTALDIQNLGAQQFANILGTTPMTRPVTSAGLLDISPQDVLGLRSQERSQKLNTLLQRAGVKGGTETFGSVLGSLGGGLLGATNFGFGSPTPGA